MEGPSKFWCHIGNFWCSLGQNHHFFLHPSFHIKVSTNYSIPSTSFIVFNMNWGKVLEMVNVMWNRWSGFWLVGESLTEICDDGNRFQLFDEVLLLCLEGLWKKKLWLIVNCFHDNTINYNMLYYPASNYNFIQLSDALLILYFCVLLYCFHE